jgi:hypothetical protein
MKIIVVPACWSVVVAHINTPLAELIEKFIFVGGETIPNVNVLLGKTLVAELVTVNVWPAKIVCVGGTISVGGGRFADTTTRKWLVALSPDWSSDTEMIFV